MSSQPAEPLTPERIRLQACRLANDGCLCDHIHCHDGWIIQAVHDESPAQRCPRCFDAVLMRAEQAEAAEAAIRRGRRWQR